MKNQIKQLKQECKLIASEIRELKSQRKISPNGYVHGLGSAQTSFRIKHIAYCMLRGRTIEQIENSLKDPNNFYHKYARSQATKLVEKIQQEVLKEETEKASSFLDVAKSVVNKIIGESNG